MAEIDGPEYHVPPALTAFLRGVERRAALFAELLCGDPEQGDLAVAQSMRGFHAQALDLPIADWPRQFWQRLMQGPGLHPSVGARWPDSLAHLASLGFDERKALLSRLAAGLPEDEAAEVLAVDLPRYHAALATACPRDEAGHPDAAGWRTLAEAIQAHARYLSPERMARLARLRGHALAPSAAPQRRPAETPATAAPRQPRARPGAKRWRAWLIAAVLLCVAALTAMWWWPAAQRDINKSGSLQGNGLELAEDPAIQTETLVSSGEPTVRMTADEVRATHPDLALLRDPEALTVGQDAALLAWHLAGALPAAPADGIEAREDNTSASEEEGRDATF